MLKNLLVGSTDTVVLTSVGESVLLIILFCNEDSIDHTLNLYCTPVGGTKRRILKDYTLYSNDTFVWTGDERFIMAEGDTISATIETSGNVVATSSYKILPAL